MRWFAPLAVLSIVTACRHAPPHPPRFAQDPATRAMADRLARLSDKYASYRLFVNPARIGILRARLAAEPNPSVEQRLEFAKELLNAGLTRESVAQLKSLLLLATDADRTDLESWLGIAELRLGEQQNCLVHHNADSCLMPIRDSGVHILKEGALAAIDEFSKVLEARPDDLSTRWLLNLAYMTAGKYPDAVAPRWLIPPESIKPAVPFPRFPDKAREAGLDFTGHAGGVITEDFRGVGLLDVMISGMGLNDQLRYFRNNGDGTFTETTDEAGLRGITGGLSMIEGDYDNDGRTDVAVLRGAWQMQGGEEPISLLHNNGDGTFSDATEKAGLLGDYQTQAAAWADFDGDGWLDLLVCNESYGDHHHPCQLFHNNHDGTFTDIAKKAGVAADALVKSVAVGDYDNDGRPDIFIASWGKGNTLLHQNPDGTFSDATAKAGVASPVNSFPSWFFDYDNDGWLDLLVFGFAKPGVAAGGFTAIGYSTLKDVAADYLGLPFQEGKPRLYRNNKDGTFSDVTDQAGLNHVMFAMGSNFADLDNDGYPDFYAATGVPDLRGLMPNRLFLNDHGRRFLDVTTAADVGHLQKGHAVAMGDLNNDGYPDILHILGGAYEGDVYQRALFVNPGGKNHWLGLTLEGTVSNRSAIGARIKVVVQTPSGPRTIYGGVTTGGSFGCSGLRQTIGLGDAVSISSVEVRWPRRGDGVERWDGLTVDGFWRLTEGSPKPVKQSLPRFAWR